MDQPQSRSFPRSFPNPITTQFLASRYHLPPKIFAERDAIGRTLAATIKGEHTNGKWRTWQDLETVYGVELNRLTPSGDPWSPEGRKQEATPFMLTMITDTLVSRFPYFADIDADIAAEQRAEMQAETPTTADLYVKNSGNQRLRLTPLDRCWQFPDSRDPDTGRPVGLYPEQDPAVRELTNRWFHNNNRTNHILIPGGTGCGKTIIGLAGVVRAMRDYQQHLPPATLPIPLLYPIHVVTVPNAVEQWHREAERCGLGDHLGSTIHIYGYNSLSSQQLIGLMTEESYVIPELPDDPFGDLDSDENRPEPKPRRIIRFRPFSAGRIFIIDECHKLANEDSMISDTFAALGEYIQQNQWLDVKSLWLSATPFEKLTDARSFVTFAGIRFGGARITQKNFNIQFASPLAKGKPTVVTEASMERLFGAIRSNVIEIPYVPWPHKSINACMLVDFEDEASRARVANAWNEHLERMAMLGKDGPSGIGAAFASLTVFRSAVEHERVPQVVRMMVKDEQNGYAPGCSAAYTGTIVKGVFDLIDNYGYSRDDISVIWGGRTDVEPEKILTPQEQLDLLRQSLEGNTDGSLDRKIFRLLKLNQEWKKERLIFNDPTPEAQQARYERMRRLGLVGLQTRVQRQQEIDKFQSGRAKFIFYTMASGGTGLSLPHCNDKQRPRKGYHSPIYSGKDFTQGFGRFPRRNSISDTYQFVVLLNGTVESEHVAPILDAKLRAASAFTSKKTDIMRAMAELFMSKRDAFNKTSFTSGRVRSVDEAASDAYNDERTQIHATDHATDEEDDD